MKRYAGMVLGALLAVTTSQAFAQQAPGLDISASAEAAYNTNVAESDEQVAAQRGLQLQDEIYTPTLTVDFLKPLGREAIFLDATGSYQFYQHDTILNRQNLDLLGGLKAGVGPCRGTVSDEYKNYQSDLDNLTTVVVRNTVQDELIKFDGSCPRTIGFAPTLSLSQDWTTNSATEIASSNYRSFNAQVGAAYTRPVFGQLTLFGAYTRTDFANLVPEGATFVQNGYQLYSAGVRFDRKLGGRIEGSLQVSFTSLSPYSSNTPGFSGFTYDADVNFRATGRIGAHFHADRETLPSSQTGSTYSIEEDYIGDIDYTLSSRLEIKLGVSSVSQQFKGNNVDPFAVITNETINSGFGSASWKLGRRLELVFAISERGRRSNLPQYNYDSTLVSATATTKF
jgi:hypothetical protein